MPSKWIEHIKDYAKSNGMSYKDALKDPKCKSAYTSGKGLGGAMEAPKDNVEMKITEVMTKRRGRPPKYFTEEDRKQAKSMKTMESNKRKKSQKSMKESDSESDMEGKGLNVGYITENANGLGHIYPISHDMVLKMLSCCPK